MADHTPTFRTALAAISVAFLGAGVPDRVRGLSQKVGLRVMRYLDERRHRFDPELKG